MAELILFPQSATLERSPSWFKTLSQSRSSPNGLRISRAHMATGHRQNQMQPTFPRRARGKTERPEPEHTHVRRTDAHIPPCVHNGQPITERNVADGPTVVRAMTKQSALKQIAPTSGGLTPTSRPVFTTRNQSPSAM